MTKTINFNAGTTYHKEGQTMQILSLNDIDVKNTEKNDLPWLQVFESGYRVTSNNIDWQLWNGCCFIDIDSKHFYEEVKKFNVDKVEDFICDKLSSNNPYNFYCAQKSNSGTGFHFIFYFDVEKTETNFKKCVQYATELVKDAFESNPQTSQIIHHNKVLDKCTISPYQGMYLTNHPIKYNELMSDDFGDWSWIDEYDLEELQIIKVDRVKENTVNFKGFKYNSVNLEPKYYEHIQRWHIYNTLIACFDKEEDVNNAWINNIVPYFKEGNGHKKSFYINEPIKNKWFERYNTKFVNEKYVEPFGFSFDKVFKPKNIQLYVPDVLLELESDKRLSDVELPLVRNKINHIFAGCGLGKTYMSKMLGSNVDDIEFVFNGQKRVCVVVPLKSISKNSFEGVENWVCVDGDLEEDVKRRVFSNPFINICTTWESFVLYEMYNIPFDYVIVDEIHTLYMYDYRVESVTYFKNVIKNCSSHYTIFMTGTPSYELEEFDCHKIQIKREDKKVNCDMVVYKDSYMGWIFNDIQEWVKDENHIALIFKDGTNYKIADDMLCYGLDIDVFNKQYVETTDFILTNENIKKQVTAFSVYGQAGINLYIDTDKKVRIYIANNTGLGIIQYANRVRNKEVIDKVVVFYKKDNICSDVKAVNKEIDLEDAKRRVEVLKSTRKEKDIFTIDTDSFIKLHYHFNKACVDWSLMVLNESHYTNYKIIQNVLDYEKQLQVIYNRLTDAFFDVNMVYLDKDVKRLRDTKMRTNQFAGQMIRFNLDMIQTDSNNNIRITPTDDFNKVITGDLLPNLQKVLNHIYIDADRNLDTLKVDFKNIIQKIVSVNGTIKKTDIANLNAFYELRSNWNKFYDKVFIKVMMNSDWDNQQLASVYMRTIYNDTMLDEDWKVLLEEVYQKICKVRKIVLENKEVFEELDKNFPVTNMTFKNDEMVGKFCKYLYRLHSKSNNNKKCKVKGLEFNTVTDAANHFNVSRKQIYVWMKKEK